MRRAALVFLIPASVGVLLTSACGTVEPAPVDKPAEPPAPAAAPADKPPPEGKVFFVEPADGANVKSPVKVVFGVEGMTVQPAGEVVHATGHHHIIVDGAAIPVGSAVPKDGTHIHYGGGQTEAELELAPGEHTLTLQFADGAHLSYGPKWSATIKVTVEAP